MTTEKRHQWRVEDMVEARFVQPSINRLLRIGTFCVKPGRDLGSDLRTARPTVGSHVAIGQCLDDRSGHGDRRDGFRFAPERERLQKPRNP